MDDFTFRGVRSRQMGAVCAFGERMTVGTRVRRSEYALPRGGSVIIGRDVYEATARTVTITPVDHARADERWVRKILTWLMAGRGEMITDRDRDVYRLVQFDDAPTLSDASWPDGMLEVKAVFQPLCYAVRTVSVSADTTGGEAAIRCHYDTGLPSPLTLEITPKSTAITAANITVGNKTMHLSGLTLYAGQSLLYRAEDLNGDLSQLSIDGDVDFGCCENWVNFEVSSGQEISVRVTGGEASVTATMRGRWIA